MSRPVAELAAAVPFVWVGMLLAISALETPLKFRAPGITLPLGLGIGRLVFRALNAVETGWAVLLIFVCAGWARPSILTWLTLGLACAALSVQR